jgi:hypothetical protein
MSKGVFNCTVIVKGRHWYKCSRCGLEKLGDRVTAEFEVTGTVGFIDALDSMRAPVQAMPVGWGNFFNGGFRCPSCLAKEGI